MAEQISGASITHYKRLNWKTKLSEARPVIVFFLAAFFIGLLFGTLAPFLQHTGNLQSLGLICFLAGFGITASIIYTTRFCDRKFFGALKSGIIQVEDRIIAGESRTQMEDLEKLVSGYLKLKRIEAADYYSKKLLELSKTGGTGIMRLSDWLVTTECWVSSADYHKGWNYKLVWLFETRGVLTLSPDKLDFQSKKIHFSCSPASIVSVELKRHPLWLKPIPFRYISIVIDEMGVRHRFNLTPSFAQTDTVFDCNSMVDIWYKRIEKVRQSMRPSAAFPDWLKDLQS